MRKGERTRQQIIEQAAPIFNVLGFAGTSMMDIMERTGLQKGGIYRHFDSKEDLALQAFDYAIDVIRAEIRRSLEGKRHAVARLVALVDLWERVSEWPLIEGGCPVLNTGTESDGTNPALRARAQAVMDEWTDLFRMIVARGVERGQLREGLDPAAVASVIVSLLQGGQWLAMLYGDLTHTRHVAHYLRHVIETDWQVQGVR